MPNSILGAFMVELGLIGMTSFLLLQPKRIFKAQAITLKRFANWAGLVLLCVTFCWSIVLGVVLSTNGIVIRI